MVLDLVEGFFCSGWCCGRFVRMPEPQGIKGKTGFSLSAICFSWPRACPVWGGSAGSGGTKLFQGFGEETPKI